MRLIDAVEKGRARVDYWCRGLVFDPEINAACVLGMAWLGTHDTWIMDSDMDIYDWMRKNVGAMSSHALQHMNDSSESYEQMLKNLEHNGFENLEISPVKRLSIIVAAITLLFTMACDPEDPSIPDVNMVVTGEDYRHGEHVMTARIDGRDCIMYGRSMTCDWSNQ